MKFHIMTLFPDMVMQGLDTSIIGRAKEKGLLSIETVNIRDYTTNKHKKVDDYPYGGGAGMLMQAQPVYDAWKSIAERIGKKPRTVYLTPQGTTFHQKMAKELALEEDLVLLCGHYEGIDERVLEEIVTDYVSIGDYVLTGGELPAMVMVDAISRMVPGVLSNEESGETESFEGKLLEYPQYSRPEVWKGKAVPEILLSGNQKKIREWRREAAILRTKERRPDLYLEYEALEKCREKLLKQKLLHIDMTELIARGQAELVLAVEDGICLRDAVSGVYFLSASTSKAGEMLFDAMEAYGKELTAMVTHQSFLLETVKKRYSVKSLMSCSQAVYTRKEKLPVVEVAAAEKVFSIRRLTLEHLDEVYAQYHTLADREYLKGRIEKGRMYGAFLGEKLAGFAGIHEEGSIGMLEVAEPCRGRKIGKALETYMINLSLEQGMTPYGQVKEGNETSMRLQESLGLYFSKEPVCWIEIE